MIYMLIAIGGVQSVITTAIYCSISDAKKYRILKAAALITFSVSLFIGICFFLMQFSFEMY